MMIYFDKEDQELLTQEETEEIIYGEIERYELHLEAIQTIPVQTLWEHLDDDFKTEIYEEAFDSILEERFIEREFEVE